MMSDGEQDRLARRLCASLHGKGKLALSLANAQRSWKT